MLQFCQQVNIDPKAILPLIQSNLTNSSLLPLITEPEFLSSVNMQLTKISECEFFIKHVFGRVREPTKQEVAILENYVSMPQKGYLKQLARVLIERYLREEKMNVGCFLRKVKEVMMSLERKDLKHVLGTSTPANFEPCRDLISFFVLVKQENNWGNANYTQDLIKVTKKALSNLQNQKEYQQQYLNIVGYLLRQTITQESHWVSLTLFLVDLLPKYPEYTATIIKRIDSIQNKQIPDCFLSKAVFSIFVHQFRYQIYFDPNKELILEPLAKLASNLFRALRPYISIAELGWLSMFSLDHLIIGSNFQKQMHICASLLRERWFHEQELISQCFCYIIANHVQGCTIAGNLLALQSILGILTPKELKYLALKLNNMLSEDKKGKIIEQCIKECGPNMRVLINHFLIEKQVKEQDEWKQTNCDRYMDLIIEIEESRYNSYQKQLKHFLEMHNFIVSHDLSSFKLHKHSTFHSLLNFYKHLLQQDYLSEQFWLNQEKISIFTQNHSHQHLEIACEFIKRQKIFNLSGAMLLTALINNSAFIKQSQLINEVIEKLGEICLASLSNDSFPSNVRLSLQFIASVIHSKLQIKSLKYLTNYLQICNILSFLQLQPYGRIHYLVESITIHAVEPDKTQLKNFINLLPFYKRYITHSTPLPDSNIHIQQIYSLYSKYRFPFSKNNFTLAEQSSRSNLKDNICNNFAIVNFRQQIRSIKDSFQFWSPIYRQQIVTLSYIKHSAEDNYYFKNHYNIFVLMEYVRILARIDKRYTNPQFINEIYSISTELLEDILKGDTLSHSCNFYQALIQSQIIYSLLHQQYLQLINPQQLIHIIEICLSIIQKENYPLLRQQIEAVLCRAYLELNFKQPSNPMRQKFIAMLKVNINSGIPLALTLGFQLLYCQQSHSGDAIAQIHQVLVKFISCHTAYLRAICQYYLHTYLQMHPQADPFLSSISDYWRQDKDSQKILKNVAVVIEGFKEAVEGHKDFIGFERVEEYASNRVQIEIYRSLGIFYSQDILGEINKHASTDSYLYEGFCVAVGERCKEVKQKYLQLLIAIQKNPGEAFIKSNMKCKNEAKELIRQDKPEKAVQKSKNKNQAKNKRKINEQQFTKINIQQEQFQSSCYSEWSNKLKLYESLGFISNWHRKDLNPAIIVIATLLEKVHNFGHILRTLHHQNAWLIVPSQLPLMHPQCKQLVPADCDVPIIEIKQRDLHKFILLMKDLGYPLVALQQCSRSVEIESAVFPERFMLLLGNERLGAPGWLLEEGDLLVQIPQVGKIRSLNVHVSMVMCVWQYWIQNK